jgi:hypothetical protein
MLFFLTTFMGRKVLKLQNQTLNSRLAFFLGVSLIILPYIFDIFSRKLVSNHYDAMIMGYLLLGPVVCALILLRVAFLRASKSLP